MHFCVPATFGIDWVRLDGSSASVPQVSMRALIRSSYARLWVAQLCESNRCCSFIVSPLSVDKRTLFFCRSRVVISLANGHSVNTSYKNDNNWGNKRSVKWGAFSRKVAATYQSISAKHHQRQPVNEMNATTSYGYSRWSSQCCSLV